MADLTGPLGRALHDRYRLERELGRGGMATVWLAEDLRHKRPVALKVLHPELAASLGVERFHREIETAARLQHPHILGVHDSGEVPASDGAPALLWFTMPYVEGESLRDRLAREGQLPVPEAVRITREMLSALGYAHAHRVIHRDIKPENILLTEEGHVLVADFGIARSLEAGEAGLTLTGMSVGTPSYMSPEQAMGEPLDARSDLYSAGCVLYEMLAGEPPFTGPNPQAIMARRLTEAVRPIRATRDAVPPSLDEAALKALARSPADRFGTAAELARALGAVVVTPTATPTTPVVTHRLSRRRWIWAAAAAVVAIAVAAFVVRRGGEAPGMEEDRIAVAPFEVLAPDLQLWREGLVDLLARNLDGAGPLHAVPPSVAIKQWSGRADPSSASALGRRTGAALVVFGTVVRSSGDSVNLRASLLEATKGQVAEEVRVAGRADEIGALADSLALRLLKVIGRDRPLGVVRGSALGTRQLPALKAFLQGETFHRRAAWDSAMIYYRRAVELDSGFALAINRMGAVLGWQRVYSDLDANALLLRAGALNHGLPPRDSLLVLADSLSAALSVAPGHPATWTIRRRLFSTAEEAVRRYAQDPFTLHTLADARYHYGLGPGLHRSRAEQLATWDRIISLDSTFVPAYVHAIELALEIGDQDRARRYSTVYATLGTQDRDAAGMLVLDRFIRSDLHLPAELDRLIDTASVDALWQAAISIMQVPEMTDLALRLARVTAERPVPDTGFVTSATTKAYPLVNALAMQGRLRESIAAAKGTQVPVAVALEAGVFPADSARRIFAEALASGGLWMASTAQPFWAAERDTVSLTRAIAWSDSVVVADTAADRVLRYAHVLSHTARAYRALARGDTTAAVREIEAYGDTLCPECTTDRLFKARLLASRGRDRDALDLLDQGFNLPHQLWVPWVLERARLEERLGLRERAIEDYGAVTRFWRDPDPELVLLRDEARAALARLTAEASS